MFNDKCFRRELYAELRALEYPRNTSEAFDSFVAALDFADNFL